MILEPLMLRMCCRLHCFVALCCPPPSAWSFTCTSDWPVGVCSSDDTSKSSRNPHMCEERFFHAALHTDEDHDGEPLAAAGTPHTHAHRAECADVDVHSLTMVDAHSSSMC
jgi:hypothetical protein